MLELIVLGTVPGTEFQITYGQAALGLLFVFFFNARITNITKKNKPQKQILETTV